MCTDQIGGRQQGSATRATSPQHKHVVPPPPEFRVNQRPELGLFRATSLPRAKNASRIHCHPPADASLPPPPHRLPPPQATRTVSSSWSRGCVHTTRAKTFCKPRDEHPSHCSPRTGSPRLPGASSASPPPRPRSQRRRRRYRHCRRSRPIPPTDGGLCSSSLPWPAAAAAAVAGL